MMWESSVEDRFRNAVEDAYPEKGETVWEFVDDVFEKVGATVVSLVEVVLATKAQPARFSFPDVLPGAIIDVSVGVDSCLMIKVLRAA